MRLQIIGFWKINDLNDRMRRIDQMKLRPLPLKLSHIKLKANGNPFRTI